jgi:two-component system, OmpR family, sensor histidine kinase ChvG
VLEKTPQPIDDKFEADAADAGAPPAEPAASLSRRAWQFFVRQSSSSLTRRIIFLNLAGLFCLVLGVLYLSQFRAGLIDARRESLLVQGEIIAAAIAASSTTADPDNTQIDLERLLDLQAGETYKPQDEIQLDFPIDPERVAPVLRRLVSPTNTRARIYDRDGTLLLDSRTIYDVIRFDLPPPDEERPNYFQRRFLAFKRWIAKGDLPSYRELSSNGKGYDEVGQALNDLKASMVRINERAEVIVSVAVPVKRSRAVRGALMLQTQGADIDEIVTEERLAIFKVFMVAAGVMVVLSFVLASTIGGPMRRLAESAQVVRRRIRSRGEIADYTSRRDEIGHLSGSLRSMTSALYRRIEAIESFAADVSHELKNPLTSLRSAVETLPLAKSEASRARLLEVIQHDVKRLDRLISDISDASRLDAEMQRQDSEPVDLRKLINTVVNVANDVPREDSTVVTVKFEGNGGFSVLGHDSRLGQVINNLIDNARSFSPQGGNVRVTCKRHRGDIDVVVDDDGPGIYPEAMEKIFDRFYTYRPHQDFGQNSGLGLSISKQIVEAHDGRLWAENRIGTQSTAQDSEPSKVLGARFTVRLPAA